ncbi:hypothetical protein IRJ41_009126 [Triplophysa rosa]|uniref:Uncharacterized protein n=1 Tax=Triplophysa rosa TaxID=992332 RepID=A0A9W7W8B7_TRIRA|nr:hypothetical protein IRJ41_009126 [Triplophysa rosa]
MPSGLECPLGQEGGERVRPRPAVDRGTFYITINPISLVLTMLWFLLFQPSAEVHAAADVCELRLNVRKAEAIGGGKLDVISNPSKRQSVTVFKTSTINQARKMLEKVYCCDTIMPLKDSTMCCVILGVPVFATQIK